LYQAESGFEPYGKRRFFPKSLINVRIGDEAFEWNRRRDGGEDFPAII